MFTSVTSNTSPDGKRVDFEFGVNLTQPGMGALNLHQEGYLAVRVGSRPPQAAPPPGYGPIDDPGQEEEERASGSAAASASAAGGGGGVCKEEFANTKMEAKVPLEGSQEEGKAGKVEAGQEGVLQQQKEEGGSCSNPPMKSYAVCGACSCCIANRRIKATLNEVGGAANDGKEEGFGEEVNEDEEEDDDEDEEEEGDEDE